MHTLVNHRIYGDTGPSVYILHGIFGMLDNWHYAAGLLSRNHKVVTYDARNHGRSFHNPDAGYDAMSSDLLRLMQHLGDEKAHIVGHSMGGKTAMHFAELYPEKVESLTIVDIAPKAYPAGHGEYFRAFETIDFSQVQSRKDAETQFLPFAPDAAVRQFLLKNIEPIAAGGYQLKINVAALKAHYEDIIGELHFSRGYAGPTLFIHGEKSGYIKETDKPNILNYFPNASFVSVPGAGHWVHADNPEAFMQVLTAFIHQHSHE